jgi:hypothetical protein
MGMDVYGKEPKSDKGEYFRNNVWWWRPLANYSLHIAPDVCAKCEYWQSNDGDGLDAEGAELLSEKLLESVEDGTANSYIKAYNKQYEGEELKYPLTVDNIENFAAFLKDSGGFEIW